MTMEAYAIRYDTPLFMLFSGGNNVDAVLPAKVMHFLCDAQGNHARVILSQKLNGKVIIRAAHNEKELVVGVNGKCFFESVELRIGEEFNVAPMPGGSLEFVSCRTTNVLECDSNGLPCCADTIRRGWFLLDEEAVARIIQPVPTESATLTTSCWQCEREDAKERRQYVMRLVEMKKSLGEINAILSLMYSPASEASTSIHGEGAVPAERKRLLALRSKKWAWS